MHICCCLLEQKKEHFQKTFLNYLQKDSWWQKNLLGFKTQAVMIVSPALSANWMRLCNALALHPGVPCLVP